MREALDPLHAMTREVERLGELVSRHPDNACVAGRFDAALEEATMHAAWDADRRTELAAQRLGVERLPRERVVARCSGGQRSRLALAALLVRRPAALLLDEPTNHLDDPALEFLEAQLVSSLGGAVLVATHDRVLLDAACTGVVDLDPRHRGVDGRGGGTWTGVVHRVPRGERGRPAALGGGPRAAVGGGSRTCARPRAAAPVASRTAGVRATTTSSCTRSRGHGCRPRLPGGRGRGAADRADPARPGAETACTTAVLGGLGLVDGAGPDPLGGSVVVRGLVVPGRLTLDRLDVARGEHLLVTGRNGSGKSTLLRVLAGWTSTPGGLGQRVVGVDSPRTRPSRMPPAPPRRSRPPRWGWPRRHARAALLPLGLLHPRDLARPVGALSVGQQRRLALALVVLADPEVLLLDEPTNHLSLRLVDELEEAVGASPATVVVASHDRWLRRRWGGTEMHLGGVA